MAQDELPSRRGVLRLAEQGYLEAEWQPKVFGSDDAKEGALAIVERRDPVWTGH